MAVFTCPGCRQQFATAGNPARVQCPHCRRVVDMPAAPAAWHVARSKKKHGPFTWRQLQQLAQGGRLRGDDMLLAPGGKQWSAASSYAELFPPAKSMPARRRQRGRWLVLTLVVAAIMTAGVLVVSHVRAPPPAPPEMAETIVEQAAAPAPEEPAPEAPERPPAVISAAVPAAPVVKPPTERELINDFVRRLNAARLRAGVGSVNLDAELSSGCAAHARYLALNLAELSPEGAAMRSEDPARQGYSDAGRAAAEAAIVALAEPRAAVGRLLARVNSRVPLLNPELQALGLGLARDGEDGWICVIDVTRGRGEPVVIFPAPGQDDVPLTFSGGAEIPNPEAAAGFPVTVTFPASAKVAQVQASLKDDQGNRVDAWLSTPEAPARPRGQRNSIALIAKAPLRRYGVYQVDVAAQVDGKAWARKWSFTTEDDSDGKGEWAGKALARLNTYRAEAGQPPVTLDPELSRGCLAHARYLAVNAGHPATVGLGAHDEDPKLPGFSEEGRKAGKVADIAIGDYDPLEGLDAWMATLYHRVPLLEPHLKTIGFGCARGRRLGWIAVLDVGSGRPRASRPGAVFYPVPDQKDVPLSFPAGGEEPNPIPDDKDGKAGYPITASFPENAPLRDATATLTGPEGDIPCWFSTPEKAANPAFPRHQGTTVCLIPHDPLLPATNYRVQLKGTLQGEPWQKRWQFTTASEGLSALQAAEQVAARVNDYRRRAGVPAVSLDATLSRGCLAHARYLVRNADVLARSKTSVNDEDPQRPGFTLEGQQASRQSDVFSQAPTPMSQVDDLMATFFRRVYLLDPNLRRIGFGSAHDVGRGWRCVLDLIGGRGDQRVIVYPGSGQTDVPCVGADHPSDASAEELGFPISVSFGSGAALRNVQAVFAGSDGAALDVILSTPDAPLLPGLPRGSIAIYPRRPLAPGRSFTITVSAILAGGEWRQSWSFTTAKK